jgi:hypothetical protein
MKNFGHWLLAVGAANSQQPTANSQQPTANSQQPTANSQQPTANSQPPKANGQPTNGQIVSQTPLGILFDILLEKVIL